MWIFTPNDKLDDKLDNKFNKKTNKLIEAWQEIWEVINDELFITEDEIKIIKEIPNPEIRNNVIKIINELSKRICNWANPSRKLINDVCRSITKKNGNYPNITITKLKDFPDWKGFAYLFERDASTNDYVKEFRKTRWHRTERQIPTPIISTNKETKLDVTELPQTKIEPESQPKLAKREQTSKVPKLKMTDISFWACISSDGNNYVEITAWLKSEVPNFDPRQEIFTEAENINNEVYCVYRDGISYIIYYKTNGKPLINLAIKGKVSKQDATELLKILQEKNIFELNPLTGNIMKIDGKFVKDIYSHWFKEIWEKVQWIAMDYFNNK